MNFKYYKTKPLIVLIAILIVIAHLLTKVFGPSLNTVISGKFKEEIDSIADYLGVFSVLGIVGIFLYTIDTWLWKTWLFRWLVDLPVLRGRYKGVLISDFSGNVNKYITLEIKQSASEIKICGYFADANSTIQTSSSYSISEMVVKGQDGFFTLFYLFANSPNLTTTQIYQHGGTVSLKYYPDIKTLKGEYYNIRKNHGTIEVKFEDAKLLGRL